MKLRRKLLTRFLCLVIAGLVGCSQKTDDKKETSSTITTEQSRTEEDKKEENKREKKRADDEVSGASLKDPTKVDKEAKEATVLLSANGKYFTENTRHAPVNTDGSNGTKSVLTAYSTSEDLYNALIEIGAKPGENVNPDNVTTTRVEGSKIGATVAWEDAGKDYDTNEVVKDSNGEKIEFRLGGNLERTKTKKIGCLTRLDPYPVGIISSTAYTYGAVEKRNGARFTGSADVLLEDGTYVAVACTLED